MLRLLLIQLFALGAPLVARATVAPILPSVDVRMPCHERASSSALSCAMGRSDEPAPSAVVRDCGDDCRQCQHHHGSAPTVLLIAEQPATWPLAPPYEVPLDRAGSLPEGHPEGLERPPSSAV